MRSSDRVIDLRLKVEAGLDDVAQILLTESAPHARQMRRTAQRLESGEVLAVEARRVKRHGSTSENSGLCRQDAQGPTPPTFSIVMRVRYPGGASGGGKPVPGPNVAVAISSSSSGAPPSSMRAVPLIDR